MLRNLAFLVILLGAVPAAAQGAVTYHGFLYSKLQAIGTRSEGPAYILQCFDGRDISIVKHSMMWQQDPALQRYVGTKVTIEGEMMGDALTYRSIKPYVVTPANFGG